MAAAAEDSVATGKPARWFKDFNYRTLDSWSRERRVIGKAEWMTPQVPGKPIHFSGRATWVAGTPAMTG